MASSWDEIAHTTLEEDKQPITADATNIAKYGAPAVALVTALLTGVLGGLLDPTEHPDAMIAGAIIVAVVVLGVFVAFAVDIWTRGTVARARYAAITTLVQQDEAKELDKLRRAKTELETNLSIVQSQYAAFQAREGDHHGRQSATVVLVEPDAMPRVDAS